MERHCGTNGQPSTRFVVQTKTPAPGHGSELHWQLRQAQALSISPIAAVTPESE